jgi:hypothetical protein
MTGKTRAVSTPCERCDGRKVLGQETTEGPVTAIGCQPISGTLKHANEERVYVTPCPHSRRPRMAVSGGAR